MLDTHINLKTCTGKKPFPFMPLMWPFIIFSVATFVLSIYVITSRGMNYGVDFLGGVKMVYQFDATVSSDSIRAATKNDELGDIQIIPFGGETSNRYIIRAKYVENKDVPKILDAQFKQSLGDGKFQNLGSETVGPKVGADLQRKGWLALLATCGFLLIYIGFRFDFLFAPGAIVALVHDVFISAGIFAWMGKEFNLPILAALLTILGYSINDTIIIYDRVRENLSKLSKTLSLSEVIDVSLTETFSRTIVTSLTVFLVVFILFMIGGGVLHDFAFCLMVGVAFGTYSSIFIASPIYLGLQKLFPTQGLNKPVNGKLENRKFAA